LGTADVTRLLGVAEFWLDKPVIAINPRDLLASLRQSGITDRVLWIASR
jgi:maleate isomerase